jgi:hypothetical protein
MMSRNDIENYLSTYHAAQTFNNEPTKLWGGWCAWRNDKLIWWLLISRRRRTARRSSYATGTITCIVRSCVLP